MNDRTSNDAFNEEATSEAADAAGRPPAPPPRPRGARRAAIRFVAVFLTSVFLLLLGSRAMVRTGVNEWYLKTVAHSTSWVLDKTGHSSRALPEHHSGPTVLFVAKAGPRVLLNETRVRIEEARKAEDEAAVEELGQEAARLDAVIKEREALPPEEQPRDSVSFRFTIIPECGAMEIFAIFIAAVLAFPTTWRKRLAGLAAGLPIMYAVNIFRLACLGWIGAYTSGGQWFDFAHYFVWQGIYIIFVVAVWLAWVELLVRKKTS